MSFFFQQTLRTDTVNPARTRMVHRYQHTSPFLGCRFDPSGRFVFAGAQDNSIQRWDLANHQKTSFTGHQSWVRALAFLPRGNQLVSGDYHGKMLWWPADNTNPRPSRTIEAHDGWLRALVVSPDGQKIASCGNDHLVKIWSADNGTLMRTLRGHESHVYQVAFHPGGQFVASCDLHGVVKQWDLTNGREIRTLDARVLHRYDNNFRADIGGARGMVFSADGRFLACSGITDVTNAFAGVGKPLVVVFDWSNGNRRLLRPRENFQGTAWGVGFHPAGYIASVGGGSGGKLWFWRTNEDQSFVTINLPNAGRDLHFHPDGRRLAIPFYDRFVRIYDMVPAN